MSARATADAQWLDPFGIGRLFWLTSEAIVGADVESERIVLWNPAAEHLFGYTPAEAVGMPLDRLVPDDVRERHLAGIRHFRDGADPTLVGGDPVAVPAVTKTGERLEVALTLTDVSEPPDRRFVVAVIRDVTVQKRAEREREEMIQVMREFVAAASHDLRNPLTAIVGFSQFLVDHGENIDADQRRQHLQAVVRNAQRASLLVNDMLTLSKIHAGVIATRPQTVSLAAGVQQAGVHAGAAPIIAVDEELAVWVDPTHLERMLVNYLTNAERYGAPPVEVSAVRQDGTVTVRVRDAGQGVPESFVPRLFTSFARADATGMGTGLGLSIVKGLANANGGDVFYERTEALGSCFGVTLPAATS